MRPHQEARPCSDSIESETRSSKDSNSLERQRIDKWLWHARVVRTRSAAAQLAAAGHVRVNGQRVDAASRAVRLGDVVTIALDRGVRVLKVAGFADRRGPAAAAQGLCEDLQPPAARADPAASRPPRAGRPTKRERRAIDRFTGDDDLGENDL
jgi:ribosome-associated heat shock protein Hsp15